MRRIAKVLGISDDVIPIRMMFSTCIQISNILTTLAESMGVRLSLDNLNDQLTS